MKTRSEYKFMSVQQKCLLMERGRTRILADSARKINRKEVLANYNKTIINICHQHEKNHQNQGHYTFDIFYRQVYV
jgi:hypothetical protein